METACGEYRRSNIFIIMVFIAVGIALITGILPSGLARSHGDVRHPGDAEIVRTCIQNGGTLQVWKNPITGRINQVCEPIPGKFGVQVLEEIDGNWEEITGFIKEKMKSLDQVMQYLKNGGYAPVK